MIDLKQQYKKETGLDAVQLIAKNVDGMDVSTITIEYVKWLEKKLGAIHEFFQDSGFEVH